MGRLVSRISCMYFAKQMVAQGKHKAVWEINEWVVDINVSCSIFLSCLFPTCQNPKGNILRSCHFFQQGRVEMLLMWMRFSGASNADIFIQYISLSFFCLFPPFCFFFFISFLVIFFFFLGMTDEGCVQVFKQPTQKNGYSFPLPFHVYFRNYFRGISESCITLLWITLCRQGLFIFRWAKKLWHKWPSIPLQFIL